MRRFNAGSPGTAPTTPSFVPDLGTYDTVIIAFSGGKDSLAALLTVLETASYQGRNLVAERAIELWHHDVDSPEAGAFMDWPITHAYVKAVGAQFGISVYFSWRTGGFLREMSRSQGRTGSVKWEEPGGRLGSSGGKGGKLLTREEFPQVGAITEGRWCSPVLKIDVGAAAICGQKRFLGKRTLVVSGERAEESPNRARYATFEPDRTHTIGSRVRRHVDRWRPVHHWSTADVWTIIARWGIVPHPAYRAGFGRVSCAFCIFGSPNQWATLRQMLPQGFKRVVDLERQYGKTIHRTLSVEARAAKGSAYPAQTQDMQEGRRLAVQTVYDAPIAVPPAQWILPAGAFAESSGPTNNPPCYADSYGGSNPVNVGKKPPSTCDPSARPLPAKVVGQRVRVHLNLHNGCYVVSVSGEVQGYAQALELRDVTSNVSQAGHRRCRQEKTRNVHAWLEGTLVGTNPPAAPPSWQRLSYNCLTHPPCFFWPNGACFDRSDAVLCYPGGFVVASQLLRENPDPTGDDVIRDLERRAATGDQAAGLKLLVERRRRGICWLCGVSSDQSELHAACLEGASVARYSLAPMLRRELALVQKRAGVCALCGKPLGNRERGIVRYPIGPSVHVPCIMEALGHRQNPILDEELRRLERQAAWDPAARDRLARELARRGLSREALAKGKVSRARTGVKIKATSGDREQKAEGLWAATKQIGDETARKPRWVITHLPTGLALVVGLPTRAKALEGIAAIQATGHAFAGPFNEWTNDEQEAGYRVRFQLMGWPPAQIEEEVVRSRPWRQRDRSLTC